MSRWERDRSGPREQFSDLFDAHAEALLAYLLRRLDEPADAADVLADVFVVAWRRLADVPVGDDGRLWLFGVARLMLQNERRRQRRGHALAQRLRSDLAVRSPVVRTAEITGAEIAGALRKLSSDDRELLMLVGWDGLTPAQAAVVLGTSSGAVRVRLHRARHQLRELLPDSNMVGNDR